LRAPVGTRAIRATPAVLDRHRLVERRGRVHRRAHGTPLSLGQRPNELGCADYKGEFLLANRQYCYALTVTGQPNRRMP
jgi:putative transposase